MMLIIIDTLQDEFYTAYKPILEQQMMIKDKFQLAKIQRFEIKSQDLIDLFISYHIIKSMQPTRKSSTPQEIFEEEDSHQDQKSKEERPTDQMQPIIQPLGHYIGKQKKHANDFQQPEPNDFQISDSPQISPPRISKPFQRKKILKTEKNLPKKIMRIFFNQLNVDLLTVDHLNELLSTSCRLKKNKYRSGNLSDMKKTFSTDKHSNKNRKSLFKYLNRKQNLKKEIIDNTVLKEENKRRYLIGFKVLKLRLRSGELMKRVQHH